MQCKKRETKKSGENGRKTWENGSARPWRSPFLLPPSITNCWSWPWLNVYRLRSMHIVRHWSNAHRSDLQDVYYQGLKFLFFVTVIYGKPRSPTAAISSNRSTVSVVNSDKSDRYLDVQNSKPTFFPPGLMLSNSLAFTSPASRSPHSNFRDKQSAVWSQSWTHPPAKVYTSMKKKAPSDHPSHIYACVCGIQASFSRHSRASRLHLCVVVSFSFFQWVFVFT